MATSDTAEANATTTEVYDRFGRLFEVTEPNNVKTQYTYDAADHLRHVCQGVSGSACGQDRSFNYDGRGLLLSENHPESGNSYEFDAFNQMKRMVTGADDWRYIYTADDERFWSYRVGGGGSLWTLRDLGGKVLREHQAHLGWTNYRDYVLRDGSLLASVASSAAGGATSHYHLDHLGTVRLITDASGNPGTAQFHTYYPFGEESAGTYTTAYTDPFRFTGHERDLANIGGQGDDLDYMHARFHSPVVGRFTSPDPTGALHAEPQGWNRFSYVRDRPLMYTDPLGLYEADRIPPPTGMSFGETIWVLVPAWNYGTEYIRIVNPGLLSFLNYHESLKAAVAPADGGRERRAPGPTKNEKGQTNCPGYWSRVSRRFTITNKAIPGLLAPTGTGFLTGGTLAEEAELVTFGQWARSGFGGMVVRGAQLSSLETGVSAEFTAGLNFVLVGLTFEGGVGVGSLIGAAFDGCDGP